MPGLQPAAGYNTFIERDSSHTKTATADRCRPNVAKVPTAKQEGAFVLRVWPHKVGSVGICPRPKPKGDRPLDGVKITPKQLEQVAKFWGVIGNRAEWPDDAPAWWDHIDVERQEFATWERYWAAIQANIERDADKNAPITLSDLLICHKEKVRLQRIDRKPRGRKGYTQDNRKMIRSGLECLHRYWGKSRCSFTTLTMPDLPEDELRLILENWRDITRRLYQEINRQQERIGLSWGYVGVTEIHIERWKRTGMPYPHIHLVCQTRLRSRGGYDLRVEWLRPTWQRILESVLGRKLDQTPRVEMAYVRTNLEDEMAGYMSKNDKATKEILSSDWAELMPHAWCNISMKVKKWIRRNTFVYRGEQISELWHTAQQMHQSGICYARSIYREVEDWRTGKLIEYLVGLYISWPSNAAFRTHMQALGITVKRGFPLPKVKEIARKGAVSSAAKRPVRRVAKHLNLTQQPLAI